MKYKERFSQFLEKYSLRELLISAEALIKNLLYILYRLALAAPVVATPACRVSNSI